MTPHQRAPAKPLYDRVERIRLTRGWTKIQMARHLGLDRKTIENWQTQPRLPLAPTVTRVADKLDIDQVEALRLAGLLKDDRSDDPRVAEIMRSEVFTDEEKDWLIKALPPRSQQGRGSGESEAI